MTFDIGPNLLAILEHLIVASVSVASLYFARSASIHSKKVNGQVENLVAKEHARAKAEAVILAAVTSQNKKE